MENKFITQEYYENEYKAKFTLEESNNPNKNKNFDYYVQAASDDINNISVVELKLDNVLTQLAPSVLNAVQRATAIMTEYYIDNGTGRNRASISTELGSFKGSSSNSASDDRYITAYNQAQTLLESVRLHFTHIDENVVKQINEEFAYLIDATIPIYIRAFDGSDLLDPNVFETILINDIPHITLKLPNVVVSNYKFANDDFVVAMDKPINDTSDLPNANPNIVGANQDEINANNDNDISNKVDISIYDAGQLAQDGNISNNAIDITSLENSQGLQDIRITSNENNIITLANSVSTSLQISRKLQSVTPFNAPPGQYGFLLTNGNNWELINNGFEPFNTTRLDQTGVNNFYGLTLQSGTTITDGRIIFDGNLYFQIGSIGQNDKGLLVIRQYATVQDAIDDTNNNQFIAQTTAGVLDLASNDDNSIQPVSVGVSLEVVNGLVLVPVLIQQGAFVIGLIGKNDTSGQPTSPEFISFIQIRTDGNSDAVLGFNTGDLIDDSASRPTEGNNPWKGLIDTNITDITALQNDKLEKGLIGTTRTTRVQYNTPGELETFSYDNITGIGFKSKVKPDGIIVNNWDNNTGTATEYTQSEPGSLTTKKYVDDLIAPINVKVNDIFDYLEGTN